MHLFKVKIILIRIIAFIKNLVTFYPIFLFIFYRVSQNEFTRFGALLNKKSRWPSGPSRRGVARVVTRDPGPYGACKK